MALKECSILNLVKTISDCSKSNKRYCFILGAGASKQSGIKTGNELAEKWLNELKEIEPDQYQDIINLIGNGDIGEYYSNIYEKRFLIDPSYGYTKLEEEMSDKSPSCGYYHLATILTQTSSNLVITTNFDSLTEDSIFIYTNKKPLVITHELLAKYVNVNINRPIIVKIHRDLLLQPKNTQDDVNTLSEEFKDVLKNALEAYTPIVIGYGGNDGSLMNFLEDVKIEKGRFYWCYRKKSIPKNRIQKLIQKHDGVLVPIDGFDETMVLLGEQFKHIMPHKQVRANAEKHIKTFNDQVNEIKSALSGQQEELSDTEEAIVKALNSFTQSKIDNLSREITNNPKNPRLYKERGEIYFMNNKYKNSIEDYTKAIELEPNNPELYSALGASYSWSNKFHNAIECYTKAIDLDPNISSLWSRRGKNRDWIGAYQDSYSDYTKAIDLDPNNAYSYFSAAMPLYEIDTAKACSFLEEGFTKFNDSSAGYRIRALFYLRDAKKSNSYNNLDYILKDFNKALELSKNESDYIHAYTYRASYFLYINQSEKAYNDLQSALKFGFKHPYTWFCLSKYYEAEGDMTEKGHCYKEAIKCGYVPHSYD